MLQLSVTLHWHHLLGIGTVHMSMCCTLHKNSYSSTVTLDLFGVYYCVKPSEGYIRELGDSQF